MPDDEPPRDIWSDDFDDWQDNDDGIEKMKIANFFDRVFVINLARRSDRREQMKAEFAKGWPFYADPEFFTAIDGETVQVQNFDHGSAAYACGQSHLGCVRKALREGCERILILEDDATFCDSFEFKAERFIENLPTDWELAFFGGEHRQRPYRIESGLVRPISTDRLHAYALSRSGMEKLETIWSKGHRDHCDWALNRHLSEFKVYAHEKWLVGQRGGVSDINGQDKSIDFFQNLKFLGEGTEFKSPFEKTFVINLKSRPERLEAFKSRCPKWMKYEVFSAIDADKIAIPDWWKAGGGAFGCYRSHLAIIERCFSDGVESVLILEDDVIFRDQFEDRLDRFMSDIQSNWEQAYLGGQMLAEQQFPPKRFSSESFIPYNVNRTHAYAVHRSGFEKLYKHFLNTPFPPNSDGSPSHIDHHMGHLHEIGGIKVRIPGEWMCGQASGLSSINGRINPESYWQDADQIVDPESYAKKHPVQVLPFQPVHKASIPISQGVGTEVAKILKSIGIEACFGCIDWIQKMNQWGPTGCEENRNDIVFRLREKMKETSWETYRIAATKAVQTGLAFKINWFDPCPGLLDLAIQTVRDQLEMTEQEYVAKMLGNAG